jgi:hypothetical protein
MEGGTLWSLKILREVHGDDLWGRINMAAQEEDPEGGSLFWEGRR